MGLRACPDCDAELRGEVSCPSCALPTQSSAAEDYQDAMRELAGLAARRWEVAARGDRALDELRRLREQRARIAVEARRAEQAVPPQRTETRVARVRAPRDLSRRAVQNLLLLFGGLLLSLAAVIFTLVSWEVPTIRAGILVVVTCSVLAAPWLLVRRGLAATAETVALLGLVLLPLAGLAVGQAFGGVTMPEEPDISSRGTDLASPALGLAVLTAAWAAYAWIAPLRLPGPAAIALAQVPLPLLAADGGLILPGLALALLVTTVFNLAVRVGDPRHGRTIERTVATVAGSITGSAGAATALYAALTGTYTAWAMSGLLVVAAAVSAGWAWFLKQRPARAIAAGVSGVVLAAGLATPVADLLPADFAVACHAVGAAVVIAATSRFPVLLRLGLISGGAAVLGVTGLAVMPDVLEAALRPLPGLSVLWSPGPAFPWTGYVSVSAPIVTAVLAILCAAAPLKEVLPSEITFRHRLQAATVLAALTAVALPVALGLPVLATVAVLVLLCALLLGAALLPWSPWLPLALAGYAALLAAAWSSYAIPVLAALFAAAAVKAWSPVRQAWAGAGAVVLVSWAAIPVAPGWLVPPFAAVLVRGAAWLIVVRLRDRRPEQRIALEAAAMFASLTAVLNFVLHVWRPPVTALLLAIIALLAASSAWRRSGHWRTVAIGEAYVLAALAPLALADGLFPALFGPFHWIAHAWDGGGAPERIGAGTPFMLLVLAIAVGAAVLAAGAHKGRSAALGVAWVALPIAATTVPGAIDLPYWAALVFLVAITAGLAGWAAVSRSAHGGAALWTASLAVAWGLADQTATLAVLGALVVIGLACAIQSRGSPVAVVASGVTALVAGAESMAVALYSGLAREETALVVLIVAIMIARAAAMLHEKPDIAGALNVTALLVWVASAAMSGSLERLTIVLAAGGLTAVASAVRLPAAARLPVVASGCLAALAAFLPHLPLALRAVVTPYGIGTIWGGLPAIPLVYEGNHGTLLAVAAMAAITATWSARVQGGPGPAWTAATVAIPAALTLVPRAALLPYHWGLLLLGAVVVALAVQATRTGRSTPGAMALALAALALSWSMHFPLATIAVLSGIGLAAAACASLGRNDQVRSGAASTATLASGGLVVAVAFHTGFGLYTTGLAMLAVSAAAALAAAGVVLTSRRVAAAIEIPGWFLAAAGVLLPLVAPLDVEPDALALTGLLAAAVAMRPDRRPALYVGLALLHVALWLELIRVGVTAPEAYTVPLSVTVLVLGWRLRERNPEISSWIAYGGALALSFVPSIAVAWSDPGLTRPLLLGATAFAVTMTGAWARLQAPLLIGGAALVLVAVEELAPSLVEIMGSGPRWIPIAVAGAALLFTGATYEHRLRDLRRVRSFISRLE